MIRVLGGGRDGGKSEFIDFVVFRFFFAKPSTDGSSAIFSRYTEPANGILRHIPGVLRSST